MMHLHTETGKLSRILALVAFLAVPGAQAVQFSLSDDVDLNVTGYARGWFGMNLNDHPELGADGTPIDGKGDLSMSRFTSTIQAQTQIGPTNWVAIGRFSREQKTDYLDDLEDVGLGAETVDKYNEETLRELYMDVDLTEDLHLRLGKQQVVWGETDFFQGMDVIHGYDMSVIQFQQENEEFRKPLWLVNLEYSIFPWNGSFQFIVRPGVDGGAAMGSTFDLFGGRWAAQPNKGVNTLALFPYNFDHDKGDEDDPSYGGRWVGIWGSHNYTLNYYRTQQQEPILNFIGNPYGNAPKNGFGEFIFPEVDIIGGTLSGPVMGGIWRGEVAYTPDKPFNFGALGTAFAGTGGVIEKDTARLMLGYDRSLRSFTSGVNTPPFLSLQLFDTWIVNYDSDDLIADSPGTAKKKEHSTVATMIFSLNYRQDRVAPSLALLHDVSYGGGLILPALEFKPGDHWRLKTELYLFYKSRHGCSTEPGEGFSDEPGCTHLFGTFDNNNQWVTRITYQF